jgi:hypothetical protein
MSLFSAFCSAPNLGFYLLKTNLYPDMSLNSCIYICAQLGFQSAGDESLFQHVPVFNAFTFWGFKLLETNPDPDMLLLFIAFMFCANLGF